jgi:hypothetical protein
MSNAENGVGEYFPAQSDWQRRVLSDAMRTWTVVRRPLLPVRC